jgi:hypothetical protein
MYNINKIGFRIGVLNRKIVITHLQTKVVYLANSDNRESFIAIEIIYKDSIAIALFLILKGDILVEDYFKNDLNNKSILATSLSGYTNK